MGFLLWCLYINTTKENIMYRTTSETTVRSNQNSDVIIVPKGTLVTPIKCGGDEICYAVIDSEVLKQQNPHDRKYRYVWVPTELVEEVK